MLRGERMLVDKPLTVEDILSDESEREKVRYILDTINSLTQTNQQGSVTIAINGDWGSGKTTYLKTLENFYKYQGFPVVFFEAWKYQEDKHPLLSLILEIRDTLETAPNIKRSLTVLGKAILSSSLIFSDIFLNSLINKGINDVKNTLELIEQEQLKIISDYRNNLNIFKKTLNKLKKNYKGSSDYTEIWSNHGFNRNAQDKKKLFVLIIDDLDRLLPQNAFKIIETLRFYFDIDDVLIIMGINDAILNKYVCQYYQGDTQDNDLRKGENFLEKIFHWNYEIGYSSHNELHLRSIKKMLEPKEISLLKDILQDIDHLTHRKWVKLVNRIEKKLRFYGKDEDKLVLHIFTAIIKEIFPDFELYARKFPWTVQKIYNGEQGKDKRVYEGVKRIVKDNSYLQFSLDNYIRIMKKIRSLQIKSQKSIEL